MADIKAQLDALANERAGYEHDGKADRVEQVDAEIARLRKELAADDDASEARPRRGRRTKETAAAPAAPETATA